MSEVAEQISHLIALSELPVGTLARIAEIRGGRQLTRRLLGLGIRVGSEVSVLYQRGSGVVLAKGDLRIALGGGITERLFVEPLTVVKPRV